MIVRPATEADLPELVAMQEIAAVAGLGHIFPQDTHPFPRDAVLERWRSEIAESDVAVFVAVADDRIVGFAATRGNELLHFGTALDTWGTGAATELHDAVVAMLRGQRPRFGELRLRVFEANGRARRFYERLGWRPTGARTRSTVAPHPVLLEYSRRLTE